MDKLREKVLILASVASMIDQFNIPNIKLLQNMGYEVHVACNFENGNTCSFEKIQKLKEYLNKLGVKYYQINFERNILKITNNLRAYKEVKNILLENKYKFLHCHSPIGGVVGRIAGYKTQTKVIYTAHGFHFFKGAPLINWLLYYPIEKYLSKYTDILITINQEDYKKAKTFHAKKLEYIPGIGIDIEKIKNTIVDKKKKREELGLRENSIVFISVGELSKRKNHIIPIRALSQIRDNKNIFYLIVGIGPLENYLKEECKKLGIENQVKFLGFRKDVYELYKISDICIFPSLQEGLPVALMEAICCNLPVVCSNIRGNNDLIINGKNGFLIENKTEEYSKKLDFLIKNKNFYKNLKKDNEKIVKKININNIKEHMKEIYRSR